MSKTEGLWKGTVGVAEHLGSDTFIHIHNTGLLEMMTVRISGDVQVKHGEAIYLTPEKNKIHCFDVVGGRIL
jgi:multiple sugar transport system ATP-binding protein